MSTASEPRDGKIFRLRVIIDSPDFEGVARAGILGAIYNGAGFPDVVLTEANMTIGEQPTKGRSLVFRGCDFGDVGEERIRTLITRMFDERRTAHDDRATWTSIAIDSAGEIGAVTYRVEAMPEAG